jgi:hypothetical protein
MSALPQAQKFVSFLVRHNANRKSSPHGIVLPYLAVLEYMVMVCRWVTIWRACRNRKFYGWSEPYDFLDQSCARMFFVVYGYGYGYGRPVETLSEVQTRTKALV